MPFKDDLHKFVDSHIREIKTVPFAIAAVGLYLVVKDLHFTTKFRFASDVPRKFFTSHVTLQGRVRRVDGGLLYVSHEPVFNIPFSQYIYWISSAESTSNCLLAVKPVGVDVTEVAEAWMSTEVVDQHVWFQLLDRDDEDVLHCSVRMRKNSFLKFSINEFLLSNGLAKLEKNFTETDIGDVVVGKVWNNLRKAERKAKRRKLGLWTDDSCVGRLSYMTLVGGFLAWPFKKIKALWMINK